jgi:hypothetical protein
LALGLRRNGKYIENFKNIQEIRKWLRGGGEAPPLLKRKNAKKLPILNTS